MKKLRIKAFAILLCLIIPLTVILSACLEPVTEVLEIQEEEEEIYRYPAYQTIEGFGASACWTFQLLGETGDEAAIDNACEMLYGDSGLKLNIYRYNIGAGSKEAKFDNVYPYNKDLYDYERRAESFFDSSKYIDATSFSNKNNYDFSKDRGAVKMFDKCLKKGNIDRVVFFANSPHYLMTYSGKATGILDNDNKAIDNLKPENYSAYCDYLFIIVKELYETKLKTLKNVPEVYISPVNEPQWDWSEAGQEGCHYSPNALAEFCKVFYEKLEKFNNDNGTNFIGDIFESGSYNEKDFQSYYDELIKYDYFQNLSHISVHSYWAEGISRDYLANLLKNNNPNINISVTEFCQMVSGRDSSIKSGVDLGKVISRDLKVLNATDWSWWLGLSIYDYNDGLVYWDKENGENVFSVTKKYYAMAHFSKYLDKGDKCIDYSITELNSIAKNDYTAYQKADGTVVIVIFNGYSIGININLSGSFTNMTKVVTTSQSNLLTTVSEFQTSITLNANSMTTLILK